MSSKQQDIIVKETKDYKLLVCPDCHKPSLLYDKHTGKKECMNKETCPTHSLTTFLTDHFSHSHPEDYP